jgi:hypothetical protein
MGPVVTPDQAAPRPNSFPLDSAVDALIAQARAEERAACETRVYNAREEARAAGLERLRAEREACDRRAENWALRMESLLAAERARVLAVIAQVRAEWQDVKTTKGYDAGWRAACDAIREAVSAERSEDAIEAGIGDVP